MEQLHDHVSYLKASNADGVTVFEATAEWCSQCKAIGPFVDKLIKKYPGARFYNYDTDSVSAGAIAQELGANVMPTFHIFKDGMLMDSVTGAKAKELEKAISDAYTGEVVEQDDDGETAKK
ncbi:thioredoxin-like protein [Dissoconium aciculare CBS 342.82]|uniref:Thioredoxin-like protein n=1 Tax=Dissoconium aciculare CBS 342.82 TaxID=1314786 RepID=A0A6J3MI37_9PEZI|nr:thioredoxin-like protein [Dissoconium aciculare CBS 342.82]KAF1827374.1 thioredoxin-like protein [Dissoconium aciculare CBS 342.82]